MALKTYSAHDVAKYFLASVDPAENDISNLKLQKLCYYAQGILSAMRDVPLYKERVYAWDHGPVVPEIYHFYKDNKNQPISPPIGFDVSMFDEQDRSALDDVLEYYGQYSAWRLRNMTHEEKPWMDAYKEAQGSEITLDAMTSFFEPQIDADYVKQTYGQAEADKAKA
jgi:uncharacterized phage-associated protein